MIFDTQKPDRMLHRVRAFTPFDPDGIALAIEHRLHRPHPRPYDEEPFPLPPKKPHRAVPWYWRAAYWIVNLFDC